MVFANNTEYAIMQLFAHKKFMKYEKLRRSWQFEKVYKHGNKYISEPFIVYVLPNNNKSVRIGLTVTKKVGKSVCRNRIKRIIREALRSINGICSGNDIVIVARKSSIDIKYSEAKEILNYLLNRAQILTE